MARWSIDVEHVDDWLHGLDEKSHQLVIAALEILQQRGPALGRPLVDSIAGSKHRNMKELRPGSSGESELRLLFAFDPHRKAILLVAGDKRGNWGRWYQRSIVLADERFDRHLEDLRKVGRHGKESE